MCGLESASADNSQTNGPQEPSDPRRTHRGFTGHSVGLVGKRLRWDIPETLGAGPAPVMPIVSFLILLSLVVHSQVLLEPPREQSVGTPALESDSSWVKGHLHRHQQNPRFKLPGGVFHATF